MMSKSAIEVFQVSDRRPIRLGSSSKGNQDKYYEDGYWYKRDSVGYEGVAEVLVSRLIRLTNANLVLVDYEPVWIQTKLTSTLGCKSASFLSKHELEWSFARVLENDLQMHYRCRGFPQGEQLLKKALECFNYFINPQKLIDQLSCLLQLDRLVINVDRHLHNIVLLQHEDGSVDIVSFDYGDSLAADVTYDFDAELTYTQCVAKACARPFSSSFTTQCDMLAKHSDFKLVAMSNVLQISDLKGLIPESVFNRMLQIIAYGFKHYLNCTITFS